MTDIQIFNRAGELVVSPENMPDDPALRERWPVLKAAYDASRAADAAYKSAQEWIASCAQQVANGEQFIRVHFPHRGDAGRISDLKNMIANNRKERFGV